MQRPGLRVRALMIAVAAVALALGVGIAAHRAGRLADRYRSLASACAKRERTHRTLGRFYEERASSLARSAQGPDAAGDGAGWGPAGPWADEGDRLAARNREQGAREARRADYWGALSRKYERAARYPWIPVEPDPPPPE